jgi:hypothetical protein
MIGLGVPKVAERAAQTRYLRPILATELWPAPGQSGLWPLYFSGTGRMNHTLSVPTSGLDSGSINSEIGVAPPRPRLDLERSIVA